MFYETVEDPAIGDDKRKTFSISKSDLDRTSELWYYI